MTLELGSPFDARSVGTESCTKRGQDEVRFCIHGPLNFVVDCLCTVVQFEAR